MKGSLVLGALLCAAFACAQTLLGNIDRSLSDDFATVNYQSHPISGGLISVGSVNNDLMLIRYDMFGNVLNMVRYDSPQLGGESVVDSAMDSTGNLYVLLRTDDNSDTASLYVVKFNANLVVQFERRVAGVATSPKTHIACSPAGSFYVLYARNTPNYQQFIQAWAANGNALWTYSLPINEQWRVASFEFDPNNSSIVAAGEIDELEARVRAIRVTDGALLYSTSFTGEFRSGYAAIQPFTGATYLVGQRNTSATSEIRVIRRTSGLGLVYTTPALNSNERVLAGSYRDASFAYFLTNRRLMKVALATNTITLSPDLGYETEGFVVSPNTDMIGVRTDTNPGRVEWYRKSDFGSVKSVINPPNISLFQVSYIPDAGDIFLGVGAFAPTGFYFAKGAIVGFQSDGDREFWDYQSFSSPIAINNEGMATDSQGFLYSLEGLSLVGGDLAKYNSNGTEIWRIPLPTFEFRTTVAAVGDAVYVCSLGFGTISPNSVVLRKFRQSDGALLWARSDFVPPSATNSYISKIKALPNGNLVLAGYSSISQSGLNPFVAVLNPVNGDLIWRRLLGSGQALIEDFNISPSGNIYALGATYGGHSVTAYTSTGGILYTGYTGGLQSCVIAGTHLLANSWLTARVVNDANNTYVQIRELNLTTGSIIRQMNRTLSIKGATDSAMLPITGTKLLIYYIEGTQGKFARWDYGTNTVEWTVNVPVISRPTMVYDAAGNVMLHGEEKVTDSEGGKQGQSTLVRLNPASGAQLSLNRITGLQLYQDVTVPKFVQSLNGRFYTAFTLEKRNDAGFMRIQRWVTPVAPVATNNSYTTAKNTTLTSVVPGVLAGDTDANADPLTAELVTGPPANKGTLTLNANGSFTFVPAANTTGATTFTYRAKDPGGLVSNTATVTITVTL